MSGITRPDDTITPISQTQDVELCAQNKEVPLGSPKIEDQFLVRFHDAFDVDNPKDWPSSRKWAVTDVLSATGFNRIMVSTIMAPALSNIAHELQMNPAESMMALSIYLLATAVGPLVIGPMSEVYGRAKVLHISNVWFLAWNIVCGFANTKAVLITARFMAGFGASSIYALAGGVLNDIWRPEQRGRSLSMYLLIPLLGAAVGPIIGGFMTFRTTWRWMFWSTSIFQAVMIFVSFTVFHETFAPVILSRRAAQLREDTGEDRYYSAHDRAVAGKSILGILAQAVTRPLRLLATHPIIQINSLISAFYYGILYIVLASFAKLWTKQYNMSVELSGLHYLTVAFGEICGSQLGAPVMDRYYRRVRSRNPSGDLPPEHRIPLAIPGAILAPLGLLFYGWVAQYNIHWAVVDLGVFIASLAMQTIGMPLQAYVMDAYVDHTSSALAASQFPRSLTAFLFPLFTPIMYERMGYGWGNSVLAFSGMIVGLPSLLTLWYYGSVLWRKARPSE